MLIDENTETIRTVGQDASGIDHIGILNGDNTGALGPVGRNCAGVGHVGVARGHNAATGIVVSPDDPGIVNVGISPHRNGAVGITRGSYASRIRQVQILIGEDAQTAEAAGGDHAGRGVGQT